MKELNLKEIEIINGGDAVGVVDGICAAVALAGILRFAIPGLNYAGYACLGWTVARGAGWIE